MLNDLSFEASLKNLLSSQKEIELIEDIVNGLIMRLIRRMCAIPENDGIFSFFVASAYDICPFRFWSFVNETLMSIMSHYFIFFP